MSNEKDAPRIRDLPLFAEPVTSARNLSDLSRLIHQFAPVLKLLGVDTSSLKADPKQAEGLLREAEALAALPDTFDDLFAEQGWILYERMDVRVARAAITRAEAGDLPGAEAILVDYFGPERVRSELPSMSAVQAFRPRMRLAEKALEDYASARYHACVPVVLALLDGMVNEVHEDHKGFFADGNDLTAWNSISAHSRGLAVLADLFRKGRKKTTTEAITVP